MALRTPARRLLSLAFVTACLCSFGYMMYLRQSYTRHMPQAPDAASARTVAVEVNYGITVFVTPEEQSRLERSYTWSRVGVGAFALAVAARALTGRSRRA